MIYLDTFTFPSLPERIGISGGAVYTRTTASLPGGRLYLAGKTSSLLNGPAHSLGGRGAGLYWFSNGKNRRNVLAF